MEFSVRTQRIERAELPDGYEFCDWHPALLADHAAVKCESFRREQDSALFPSLKTVQGCRELMRGIMTHRAFLPRSTWLIRFMGNDIFGPSPCATIQGLALTSATGSIQNVGVTPEHRSFGLGRALVLKSLRGFRAFGLERVYLDVTADNEAAIGLYESIGFQRQQIFYREVPTEKSKSVS